MARLANHERDRILRGLKPSFQKEVDAVKRTMAKLLNEFIVKNVPADIFVFMKKHPNLVLTSDGVYINLKNGGSTYVEVIKYPSNYTPNLFAYATQRDSSGEIARTLDLLKLKAEEARILEKRITCVLANISTVKKLKDEFPEAYEVYMQGIQSTDAPENMCDSMENVRAELSKLNK